MKKIFSLCCIGILILALGGCGSEEKSDTIKPNNNQETEENKNNLSNKEDSESKDKEVENKEEKIEKEFKLYLFNTNELKEEIITEKLKVEDKSVIKTLTEALKLETREAKFMKLPKEAEIKSASIKDGILTVNFSKDFLKEMTLGTATESGLISMLVNTYGHGVEVSKVRIEFNGNIYQGLGEEIEKNGYFIVK
ncbi:GerMN domain-containing protein [uncultured Clostridium sp.]|uniref:GerMN domain-containing protein n=1 Tax=uncultured Clostridium sp. TaxID=59620 RepID=UPI0026067136|nr:GerMN domain-containing protein [uncultured Clostridium sp.]